MKVCENQFPIGSYPYQKTEGYHLDDNLASNIEILAKKITDDMDFVLLLSGNGMVRVGKSALAQQLGTFYTSKVNELHNLNNTFDEKNIVFNSNELMDRALSLPKYSVLILDEGDDLTDNFWSDVAKNIRRFFRKCGQLNLFLILLIPDFFELPMRYSITRSIALINVKFYGEFERGMFQFFDFEKKKKLYIKGKKFIDYRAEEPSFYGSFINLYTIGDEKYRALKRKNLEDDNAIQEQEDGKLKITPKLTNQARKIVGLHFLRYFYQEKKKPGFKVTLDFVSKAFGVDYSTVGNWIRECKDIQHMNTTTLFEDVKELEKKEQ
jgi:hypothetical protein